MKRKKKRDTLNTRIKDNELKVQELTSLAIVNDVNSLTLDVGISADELLTALRQKDYKKLKQYLKFDEQLTPNT